MQRQVEFYMRALSRLAESRARVGVCSSNSKTETKSALQRRSRTLNQKELRARSAHELRAAALVQAGRSGKLHESKSPISTRTPDSGASTSDAPTQAPDITRLEHTAAATSGDDPVTFDEAGPVHKRATQISKAAASNSGASDSASCIICHVLRATDPQLQLEDYRRWRAAFLSKRTSQNSWNHFLRIERKMF